MRINKNLLNLIIDVIVNIKTYRKKFKRLHCDYKDLYALNLKINDKYKYVLRNGLYQLEFK